jgi:Kef-type K+ transport system membrane component KefB
LHSDTLRRPVTGASWSRAAIFYLLLAGGAAALFFVIQRAGGSLAVPPAATDGTTEAVTTGPQSSALLHILLALAAIIAVARVMGALFRLLRQPPVIGEIIGGIFLGPSILGRIAPGIAAYILPESSAPLLGIIAQLGVILFMFLVGLELDLKTLRRSGPATLTISHASIVAPFVLGAALALLLYERYAGGGVSFVLFALFLGVSMSVTAFPVLARILTDRGIHRTPLGVMALASAAVGDVTAWSLLAFIVGVAQSRLSAALVTLALTVAFIMVVFFAVRPALGRLVAHMDARGVLREAGLPVVLVAVLLSAIATEYIGIHALFGAFALGAVIPHDSALAKDVRGRIEDLVRVLLLPTFFAFTGMRTQLGLLDSSADWLLCGLVILVATAGKFGGSLLASRLAGLGWRDAASLGVLLNTRGLVELIVLNIGLDLGVLSPRLFTIMVIMALVTSFATTPVLDLINRKQRLPPVIPSPAGESLH